MAGVLHERPSPIAFEENNQATLAELGPHATRFLDQPLPMDYSCSNIYTICMGRQHADESNSASLPSPTRMKTEKTQLPTSHRSATTIEP